MSARTTVLLVEDNPGDADLVREHLAELSDEPFDVVHVTRAAEAGGIDEDVDVVLLDLNLPDAHGLDTVGKVCSMHRAVPVVVLTDTDDEVLAKQCVDAGAEDYLRKGDIDAVHLRRSLGFAISRSQERRIRDVEASLEHYPRDARHLARKGRPGVRDRRAGDAHQAPFRGIGGILTGSPTHADAELQRLAGMFDGPEERS